MVTVGNENKDKLRSANFLADSAIICQNMAESAKKLAESGRKLADSATLNKASIKRESCTPFIYSGCTNTNIDTQKNFTSPILSSTPNPPASLN